MRILCIIVLTMLYGCVEPNRKPAVFAVRIVDNQNGWGIPMVELRTLHAIATYTDNEGWIAIDDADLVGQKHYFTIHSPGYRYAKDSLGREAVVLMVSEGKDTTLYMDRQNVAERLYRVTGMGKKMHSNRIKARAKNDKAISGGVLGQDSNLAIPYQGRILWVWGDTFLPEAYHGNFSVSAAWSTDPRTTPWSAENGIPLDYITDTRGYSRPMIHLEGPGYVWFDWLMTIPDVSGQEKLVAKYARVNAYFGNYERGVALFNDDKQQFEKIQQIDQWRNESHSTQHPILVEMHGKEYYYIFDEFNFSRVNAHLEEVVNPDAYEYFHCLEEIKPNGSLSFQPDRGNHGEIIYSWKKNREPFSFKQQTRLIQSGIIRSSEGLIQIRDVVTGDSIDVGRGSMAFNSFRQRWICIWGKQDIWYGEADTPVGPWVYAKKVATHNHYYYNPVHHAFLDEENGERIYFEGTFTKFFSTEPPIPRYEYNQLLYGLSLLDKDIALPVPVYLLRQSNQEIFVLRNGIENQIENISKIPFFALDRAISDPAIVAIHADSTNHLQKVTDTSTQIRFYAIDPNYDLSENYRGRWEGKIHFKSFDNFLQFELVENEGIWKIISSRPSFQFFDLHVNYPSFQVKLTHEGDTYEL